jgi:hypothetical protein
MPPSISNNELDLIAAAALQSVLAGQFQLPARPASSAEVAQSKAAGPAWTGSVELQGEELAGRVWLQSPGPWIESLNGSLGNGGADPAAREGECLDLAGELCNMMAGRIAAGLAAAGCRYTLSTPTVIRAAPPPAPPGGKTSQTCWTCAGGVLTLTVWISR